MTLCKHLTWVMLIAVSTLCIKTVSESDDQFDREDAGLPESATRSFDSAIKLWGWETSFTEILQSVDDEDNYFIVLEKSGFWGFVVSGKDFISITYYSPRHSDPFECNAQTQMFSSSNPWSLLDQDHTRYPTTIITDPLEFIVVEKSDDFYREGLFVVRDTYTDDFFENYRTTLLSVMVESCL
ncbi:hypothetical protein [Umboniibacter marinipuniceus]|uniref:Uncharacterized protein n=1 Tax=Umboniibacter marinipuniceus TaxID=569599 RepID=A0A3M0ACE1_9GAMM|nr:hypothetical protein [Umboniibacter marinipuniceus]RMA82157.1 hypothetical protein DFR27_0104 [Umboniibacter marinipuniceus]